jgi:transcriptional regulator with XRE-family HTH domain
MKQESLARKLQLLRAERGLTLVQASALTGVTRGTLSELESGKRVAYMPTLSKIAEGYGVNVRELLLEEPVPLADAPAPGPLHHVRRLHDSIEVRDDVKIRLEEQFNALIHDLETIRRSKEAAELVRVRDEVLAAV